MHIGKFISGHRLVNLLFYLGLVLHLVCVLLPDAFLTHDGPSHLYNARVVNELLFGEASVYHSYHEVNPSWWLQPNLSGYLFLCLFQLFLPFLWAEKITIALYVIGFAFGFRYFLRRLHGQAEWMSLLVLPFLFNEVLFWGFYNFIIGLALNFWLLGYYEKTRTKTGWASSLVLVLLSLLVFYSHAMIFLVSASYVAIREAMEWLETRKSIWPGIHRMLFFIPGSLLFLLYMLQPKPSLEEAASQAGSLWDRFSQLLLDIDSLSFTGYSEGTPVLICYFVLLILTVLMIAQNYKSGKRRVSASLVVVLMYLLALLFTPNAAAGGSIILIRLNLLFFLFLLVWLAGQSLTSWSKGLLLIYFLSTTLMLGLRWELIKAGSSQVEHVLENSKGIMEENTLISTVHYKPVNSFVGPYQIHCYFDLVTNIDHYAAIDNKVLNLHNYEATRDIQGSYFPVIWKKEIKDILIVWDEKGGGVMEYIDLDVAQKELGKRPQTILSIGSSQKEETRKAEWDPENRYTLSKADSIGFLKVYRDRGVPSDTIQNPSQVLPGSSK